MGQVFVTSDLHLGNKNIWYRYETETRPFKSQANHDDTLVRNWNKVVGYDDDVYVLGDFVMGPADKAETFLSRLNGRVHLVLGNHDSDRKVSVYRSRPDKVVEVVPYAVMEVDGVTVVMNHYPLSGPQPFSPSTDSRKRPPLENTEGYGFAHALFDELPCGKRLWLYGHVHSNAPRGLVGDTFHVGVDTNGLAPVNLSSLVAEYSR